MLLTIILYISIVLREVRSTVFLIVLAFFTLHLNAQVVYNGTTLHIPEGLEVVIPDNLENQGFVRNNGTILISGNWLNNDIYQGLGTISFNGLQNQTIDNNNQPVSQVIVTGGGSKVLASNLFISEELVLENGVIITKSSDILSLGENIEIIGGSELSYIDGPLAQQGSGYKFFPIGKNNQYLPVEFWEIVGADPLVNIEAFDQNPPFTASPQEIINDIAPFYWTVNTSSGVFENGSINFLNYNDYYDFPNVKVIVPSATNDALVIKETLEDNTVSASLTGEANVIGLASLVENDPSIQRFYFSNTLSPSASDPENRVVKIFGNELLEEQFEFRIYNRWGIVVFETTSLKRMTEQGWAGRQLQNSDLVESGSYPYQLRALNKNGEKVEISGSISVVR